MRIISRCKGLFVWGKQECSPGSLSEAFSSIPLSWVLISCRVKAQNRRQTEDRLLGFSYKFGITVKFVIKMLTPLVLAMSVLNMRAFSPLIILKIAKYVQGGGGVNGSFHKTSIPPPRRKLEVNPPPTPFGCPNTFTNIRNNFFSPPLSGRQKFPPWGECGSFLERPNALGPCGPVAC